MKLADVTYEGPMRSHIYRCRSGNTYTFNRGRPVPVYDMDDAKEMAEGFDVDWTIHGEILRRTDGSLDSMREEIAAFGYRKKQSLAKSLGIKANQSEEELEEQLQEEVEELQLVAENQ